MTLDERIKSWLAGDPDSETRAELEALAKDGTQAAELADRFTGRLEFGTAGLRGLMAAGPNRMNRAVVIQTAHAIGQHLRDLAKGAVDVGRVHVVVGYDGRKLSRVFAEDTAGVLAAQGITVHLFSDACPTPALAFATKELKSAAGIMVTASHNPPEYNGYKVYWRGGVQIVPPVDRDIAARIERTPPASDIPRISLEEARGKGFLADIDPRIEEAYVARVVGMAPIRKNASLRVVYTAMHGVGDRLARIVLEQSGYPNVFSVPEQAKPDGAFPTVRFPNPEEKGALDLAKKHAKEYGADVILANDPDADRLAVCAKARPGSATEGEYVQLTGNELGVLLGHHTLSRLSRVTKPVLLASIVSSPMLGFVARALGAHYEETLTGFKWIANRAIELEKEGFHFVFGYEEALGYTAFDLVRDKDGIGAARLFVDLAQHLHDEGRTVWSELDLLAGAYGVFLSGQHTVTYDPKVASTQMAAAMKRLRDTPPTEIAGVKIVSVSDYQTRLRTHGIKSEALTLPASNVLSFELAGGSRVMVRPSGTEPKTKVYLDARAEVHHGETVEQARTRAEALLAKLKTAAPGLAGTQ